MIDSTRLQELAPDSLAARQQEELRDANERHMTARLEWEAEKRRSAALQQELTQSVESLRWWAVAMLGWQVWETLQPALNTWGSPRSWANRLSILVATPPATIGWFSLAALMILPLIAVLVFAPRHRSRRSVEGFAVGGLGMAGVGYVFLATGALALSTKLDIPGHVAPTFASSAAMLLMQGLLVACWSNSREQRKQEQEKKLEHRAQPQEDGALQCADA